MERPFAVSADGTSQRKMARREFVPNLGTTYHTSVI